MTISTSKPGTWGAGNEHVVYRWLFDFYPNNEEFQDPI